MTQLHWLNRKENKFADSLQKAVAVGCSGNYPHIFVALRLVMLEALLSFSARPRSSTTNEELTVDTKRKG